MENTNSTQQSLRAKWMYWRRSAVNLLRMGHCAPTVMKTLLDVAGIQKEWLVKLSAGMPGGIGNTGVECGAVTSPLVLMGLRYGLRDGENNLPAIIDHGHALCQYSLKCHETLECKQIRKDDHFPKRCIRPVLLSPQLFLAAVTDGSQAAIPAETRQAYRRIYSHWVGENFHCAQAVFGHLQYTAADRPEIFDAVSAFMGGTLFMGMTCSAFAAGVMLVGLRAGEIENSPARVIRLLMRMTFGGNAFDDNINKFNRSMNAGYRMSKWFRKEFGSTQCRVITGCDFSTEPGVDQYIQSNCITRCREIAARMAEKVQETLTELEAIRSMLPERATPSP